jgi:hypothetical protein
VRSQEQFLPFELRPARSPLRTEIIEMHKILKWLRVGIVFTAVFFAGNNVLSTPVLAAKPPKTIPCTPAYVSLISGRGIGSV